MSSADRPSWRRATFVLDVHADVGFDGEWQMMLGLATAGSA